MGNGPLMLFSRALARRHTVSNTGLDRPFPSRGCIGEKVYEVGILGILGIYGGRRNQESLENHTQLRIHL